jgi:hypothetical protein
MVWAASMGTMGTMGTMPGSLRQQFEAEGYVLLRGGIPQPLLRALQAAVQPLLAAHFAGETGSQRHQTILEPNFFQPEFLEFLNLETLNHAAAEIIGVDHPASLSFSGLALLMGHTEPTALNWHRDFGDDHPESPQLWERPTGFIQFNCALFDDPSLWFVPSSHNRPSTSPELSTAGSWPSQDRSLPLAVASAATCWITRRKRGPVKHHSCTSAHGTCAVPPAALLASSISWRRCRGGMQWRQLETFSFNQCTGLFMA